MKRSKDGWWDLTTVWDEIYSLGNTIDIQKKDFKSTRGYRCTHRQYNDSHVIGLVGEYVIELESGLPFDREIRVTGDRGQDFVVNGKTVDVKCSTFVPDPDLKNPVGSGHWADYFILVVFNEWKKEARLLGWTTGDTLMDSTIRDYGYGPQRIVNWKDLTPGLPPVFK